MGEAENEQQLYDWGDGVRLPKPRHGRCIAPFKVRRIEHLADEHLALHIIAERIGVNRSTVVRYLRILGRLPKTRAPREPGGRAMRALRMFLQLHSERAVADALGVATASVMRYLRLARQLRLNLEPEHLSNRRSPGKGKRFARATRLEP